MPSNPAIQSITLEIESLHPVVRIDNQLLIFSIIEMIPKEPSHSMFFQLILTDFPYIMMTAVSKRQFCLGFSICNILHMMGFLPVQYSLKLLCWQIKSMNISSHIISEILMEPCQLKMDFGLITRDLDIASNICIKHRLVIIQQSFQIILTQKKTHGFSMIDVECRKCNKVWFRRNKLYKNAISEI